jgi:hypothetical protein
VAHESNAESNQDEANEPMRECGASNTEANMEQEANGWHGHWRHEGEKVGKGQKRRSARQGQWKALA